MVGEWRETTLGQICELRPGSAFPTRYQGQEAGDFPFIKVSDMELPLNHRRIIQANHWVSDDVRRELGANVHPPGATIFAKIGVALTFNRRRILTQPTIIDNNMMSAAPRNADLDADFLFYLLSTLDFNEIVSGTALPYLSTLDLAHFEVRLPPLPEQRAIAHILGTLDDKIELNRQMSKTLEQMARAIFKAWFVDFEPVRAKMEGRWRRGESLPGLPAHLYDLFPARLVDSELGEIPEGWGVECLGHLGEVTSGKRPDERFASATSEANVPLWGGNGPMAYVRQPLFTEPILLTGRVGTLGSVFRIPSACWPSDNTLVVLPRERLYTEYLYLFMKQIDFDSLNRGSTQPLLTQTDLKSQPLVIPPNDVLSKFHEKAEALYGKIDAIIAESRTLAALRDALLPKLIRGEIRVKDAERFLKERGL